VLGLIVAFSGLVPSVLKGIIFPIDSSVNLNSGKMKGRAHFDENRKG